MHKARSFFFVCAGIFLLALAFHLGAMTATAQAPSNPVVASFVGGGGLGNFATVTANGDVYVCGQLDGPWSHVSNVFGGATPATQSTWGQLKSRYRPGAATQDK
jgi:hypothetical protein